MDEADVICPYCGESVNIRLDPSGGAVQEYVEDCEVCCQPWRLLLRFSRTGQVQVRVERAQ